MDFSFTDDQLLFRDTVADLLAKECPPELVRQTWENETGRTDRLWPMLAEMGVVGLTAPEAAGGYGLSEVDLVLLVEAAGHAALPEPLVDHTAVAIPALAEASGPEAQGWLSAAAAGDIVLATAIGGARYAVGAEQADLLIVQSGAELYAVESASATLTPHPSIDGSRRLSAIDWSSGAATRLEGADPKRAFDRGAVATAAACVGVAQHLLDVTVDYVGEREQFGKPVGVNQAVKHHLSNTAMALEFARPATYRAAWCVANDDPVRERDVSMAKALASDAVDLACRTSLQCHGAIGYTYEYDLQLWMKRGWALAASWGDAAWHRNRVGIALGI